ncbi:hypothetical protein [Streptococcus acidominimus]|nr:hypothetical protein [Streptococcus acidominimus]OLF49081.1 hypothetical protein BU200_09320 [Streptococcus acidominimus]
MPITKFIESYCSNEIVEDVKRLMAEEMDLFSSSLFEGGVLKELMFQKADLISIHPKLKRVNLILLHISLTVSANCLLEYAGNKVWKEATYDLTLDYYLRGPLKTS